MAEERVRHGAEVPAEDIRLWSFSARDFHAAWKAGVVQMQLEGMESVYQARHGGASRDFLQKKRSALEIQLRMHHSTPASTRLYVKPGRLQQVLRRADPRVLQYAGRVQKTFVTSLRSGDFPAAPTVPLDRRG